MATETTQISRMQMAPAVLLDLTAQSQRRSDGGLHQKRRFFSCQQNLFFSAEMNQKKWEIQIYMQRMRKMLHFSSN